jgi:hypothetical protein
MLNCWPKSGKRTLTRTEGWTGEFGEIGEPDTLLAVFGMLAFKRGLEASRSGSLGWWQMDMKD